MIAFPPKALAASIVTLTLSSSALACLKLTGVISDNEDYDGQWGKLTAVDNGVQTCTGLIRTNHGNLREYLGYKIHFLTMCQLTCSVFRLHKGLLPEL